MGFEQKAKAVLRGKFIATQSYLKKQTKKTLDRQPNFLPKTTGKRRKKNPKLVEGKKSYRSEQK